MNLKLINDRLIQLLGDLNFSDLPNKPNIGGLIIESDVSFAIVSGERNSDRRDRIQNKINISVSATLRKDKLNDAGVICNSDDQNTLYDLIETVIFSIHKQVLSGNGQFLFVGYENFTPESGKWRSLLTFTVDTFVKTKLDIYCGEL